MRTETLPDAKVIDIHVNIQECRTTESIFSFYSNDSSEKQVISLNCNFILRLLHLQPY